MRTVRSSSRLLAGLLPGGVPGPGGGLLRGVPGPGGGWYPSMHWGRPPPCEQNDRQV